MDGGDGVRSFLGGAAGYDLFMGRYSRPLSVLFADAAGVEAGNEALDVGCGPGALTAVLVDRLGAAHVSAVDPSPPFVAECAARHPEVHVEQARAEALPFADRSFDLALSQLVLHFVGDAEQAVREFRRVLRPGGTAAACVWDFAEGMEMLRSFWDAALTVDPDAPDEARTMRFGRPGEIAELLVRAGFRSVQEETLEVSSTYAGFDELWSGFLAGIGPAGSYCAALEPHRQEALKEELFRRLGSPTTTFELSARARSARGRAPG